MEKKFYFIYKYKRVYALKTQDKNKKNQKKHKKIKKEKIISECNSFL